MERSLMEKKIPHWLLESQRPFLHLKDNRKNRSLRRGFVEKTLDQIACAMKEEFFAEKVAGKTGLLQGFDPRVKIITTIFLIIVAGLIRHPLSLLAMNLWLVSLAKMSKVPLKVFLKRVWPVTFLFAGVIIFPSIFNFVYPGDPLVILFEFGRNPKLGPWTFPDTLAITSQGLRCALTLIIRAGTSVSLAVILTLTTRWNILLKGLNMFFVPQVFIAVLEMSYRYIFLFMNAAGDIFMARKSRTVGLVATKDQRRFVSGSVGALWSKAYMISKEVHEAMISRGYSGRAKAMEEFRISGMDFLWLFFIIAVGFCFLGGDRVFGQ